MDFRSASMVQSACTAGLNDNFWLGAVDEDGPILLTSWISMIHKDMMRMGMDTVFKVLDEDGTTEHDILQQWSTVSHVDIEAWEHRLRNSGVGISTLPCQYDEQNLDWSGQYLLNSISPKLYQDITSIITHNASGPCVLQEIINIKQIMDASGIRTLERQLQTLKLVNQPAENVLEFSKKVQAIALKLSNCTDDKGAPFTRDLSAMVAKCYTSSTVEIFRNQAQQIHLRVNRDPRSMSWDAIIRERLQLYCTLKGQQGEWHPAGATKPQSEQINVLKKTINQLTSRIDNFQSQRGPSNKNLKCYDCGKPGVKLGHNGCTQKGKRMHLPKDK